MLAECLVFSYPKPTVLLLRYCEAFMHGCVQMIILLTHREEGLDAENVLATFFNHIETVNNPGIPVYEVFAVATLPKGRLY